jgi:hypothetical protein
MASKAKAEAGTGLSDGRDILADRCGYQYARINSEIQPNTTPRGATTRGLISSTGQVRCGSITRLAHTISAGGPVCPSERGWLDIKQILLALMNCESNDVATRRGSHKLYFSIFM